MPLWPFVLIVLALCGIAYGFSVIAVDFYRWTRNR
jgi:hypothetical protein